MLNISFTILTGFSFSLFGFFVILIGLILYFESRSPNNSRSSRTSQTIVCLTKFFSFIFISFCTYLSLPIFLLLLVPLHCTTVNGESVVNNDSSRICWSGLHIGVVLVNVINFLIFFIFLVMIETLVNESNPKSALPWAGYDSGKSKIVKHLSKIVIVCFALFDTEASFFHYYFTSITLLEGFTVYLMFISPPYINRLSGYFTLYLQSALTFMMLWMYILRLSNIVVLYIGAILVMLIFLSKAVIIIFAKDCYDHYVLSQQVWETKNISQKVYYFYEIFYYLSHYSNGDSVISSKLNGVYMNHQLLCKNSECSCSTVHINSYLKTLNKDKRGELDGKDLMKMQGNEEVEKRKSQKWEKLSNIFQVVGSKNLAVLEAAEEISGSPKEKNLSEEHTLLPPTNYETIMKMVACLIESEIFSNLSVPILRIISAYFTKEFIGNFFKAIYDLLYIEDKLKPSLQESFLIYKTKKDIGEEIAVFSQKKTGENVVDVEALITFEEYYKAFRSHAETASNYANRFWELLKNKDIDVNGLYDIGSKVGEIYIDMQTKYAIAIEIFPQNHKLVRDFGLFEKYIMNNNSLSNSYEEEAKRILLEQEEQGNLAETSEISIIKSTSVYHTSICVASGNPGSIGDIISINDEIQYSLDFRAKEVIGQNITAIIPPYIGMNHNRFIEAFLVRGDSNFLGGLRVVQAINSKGFLVTIDLIIKILPSVSQGLRFVCIFKKFDKFNDFFSRAPRQCYPQDFALIITNLDGQIIGINENCMIRLGIPISLFRGGVNTDDTITLQSLIKELNEVDVLEELKTTGREVEIDTKIFLYSVNRENLSPSEIKSLENQAGKYRVFARLIIEKLGNGIVQIQHCRMIILSNSSTELLPQEKENKAGYSDKFKEGDTRSAASISKQSKLEEKNQMVVDSDQNQEQLAERSLNEVKQNINSKSNELSVSTITFSVHFLIVFILSFVSVEFGLIVTENKNILSNAKTMFTINQRVIYCPLIHSQVFANVNMTNSSTSTHTPAGINLYEYLREYGLRSIGILSSAEDAINTANFDYTDALYSIEKKSTIQMITLGMNMQYTTILHTLNTAITQYTSKASDFMSYSFSALRSIIVSAATTDSISTQYYFIIKNGLNSLAVATKKARAEFTQVMKNRSGKFMPYYIAISVLIGIAVIICFAVIVPKLVGIQGEKIHILLLYTQMNRIEANTQIANCVKYQQESGYFEQEENSNEQFSIDLQSESDFGSTPHQKNAKKRSPKREENNLEEDKESYMEESKQEMKPEKKEESFYSDSSSEEEEEEVDENEKTIYETLDTTKLHAKLTTNKCCLVIASIFASLTFCCYPLVSTLMSWEKVKEGKEMLDIFSGVSNFLKTPLYLVLYSLVSVKNNETITIDNVDAINTYLNEFMLTNSFAQTLTSSGSKYLNKIRALYADLDSSRFCSQYMNQLSKIQNEFGSGSFTYMKTITEANCRAYEDSILQSGLTQATFMVHQVINKLQAVRGAGFVPSLTDALKNLYMLQIFIAPAVEGMMIELREDIISYMDYVMSFSIGFYVVFVFVATCTHFLFWTCFFNSMRKELVKSRGMLRLIPLELIKKLKAIKIAESPPAFTQSLLFFKQIQKKN